MTGLANLSTGGPGCVLLNRDWSQAPADVAVPAWRSRRTGTACPPKKAVREAASRLFITSIRHRAGPPFAPPSISPKGSGPIGAGWLTSLFDIEDRHSPRRHGWTRSGHPRLATRRAAKTGIPGTRCGLRELDETGAAHLSLRERSRRRRG